MTATLDRITVRCECCGAKLGINANTTKKHVKCPKCGEMVAVTKEEETFSELAAKEFVQSQRTAMTTKNQERPWFPFQILLAYWICGPLAGGVVAGVNFARMGKRAYLLPCILLGALFLFGPLFGLMSVIHDRSLVQLGMILSFLTHTMVGLAFMFAHQPHFHEWKEENWDSSEERGFYFPNSWWLYLSTTLACWVLALGSARLVIFLVLGL